jgi:hypothetical protein
MNPNKLSALQRELRDREDLLPPTRRCWARAVDGTTLTVLFDRRGSEVVVLAVKIAD